MPSATEHAKFMIKDIIGRVFAWNVMDHVESGHLPKAIVAQAWRYYVDGAPSLPSRPEGVIYGIGKWPGEPGRTYRGLATWCQGTARAADLDAWTNRTLYTASPTDIVDARLSKGSIVRAGAPVPSPLPTAPEFSMVWLSLPVPAAGTSCDEVRDLLGLVHRTVENGDDLTLLEFGPGSVNELARPTALDSGAHSRFCAVSEQERKDRTAGAPHPVRMGRAAHLDRVRRARVPYTVAEEAVAVVDSVFIHRRSGERPLGRVTRSAADDAMSDPAFERFLARGRARDQIVAFFEEMYRAAP